MVSEPYRLAQTAPSCLEGVSRMSSKSISSEELAEILAEYRRDYETRLQSRPNIEAQQARQLIQKARDLIRKSGIGELGEGA